MKIRQKPPKRARIEIIPMIDVIFFLLVFFMISSLALTRINGPQVSLPKTSSAKETVEPNIVLTVKNDGSIFVNKTPVTLESLGVQLAYEMREKPQEVVVINADQGTGYGQVIQLMDRARQIGVRKFALATEAQ